MHWDADHISVPSLSKKLQMNFSMSDLELISTIVATLASSYLDIHRVPDSFSFVKVFEKLLFFSRTYLSAGSPYSVQLMEPSSLPYMSSSIECWSAAEQASVFASCGLEVNKRIR